MLRPQAGPHAPGGGAAGAYERWRRAWRRRLLEPVLVGTRSFRETVMNALAARGHLVYCRLPDASFFVDPSDRTIGTHLAWRGHWQRGELERAVGVLREARRLPPQAVFVDVGANIGTQTVYAMATGAFARALSIEPEPRNLELLGMNIAANRLGEQVTPLAAAAGDSDGAGWLHLHPRNKGNHTIGKSPSRDGLERIEVAVQRLDTILPAHGIEPGSVGLIWIDAEGSEPQVVSGLGRYLEAAPPLVVEFVASRYGEAARAGLLDTLRRHYAWMLDLGRDGSTPQPVGALATLAADADLLVY